MNLFPNAKWLFFDVGYTLLDETQAWDAMFASLSADAARDGLPVSTDVIWQTFRQVAIDFEPKQWWALCKRLAPNEAEAKRLENTSAQWRHELQVPHSRAGDVLRVLAQRYKLGIIANQALGTAERMQRHGWADYFSCIIGSAEAGVSKPDVQIFTNAFREAGCTPAEAVMIGDRIDNDITPANLLGCGTIHVRQGPSCAQKPRNPIEEPTASVAGIAQVPDLFGMPLD